MRRPNLLTRRGDTLIEVIFALAILATILTVVTTGAVTAWRTSRLAGERTQVAGVINEQAEALKALKRSTPWTSFSDETGGPLQDYIVQPARFCMATAAGAPGSLADQWSAVPVSSPSCQNIHGNYNAEIDVSKDVGPGGSPTGLLKFTIYVKWQSSSTRNNVENQSDQVVLLGDEQ